MDEGFTVIHGRWTTHLQESAMGTLAPAWMIAQAWTHMTQEADCRLVTIVLPDV